MAKNVFEKKKRVTHVKGLRNSIDCEDMLPVEFDVVSSIIQNMDTNYEHMKLNNFKINNSTKVTNKTEQNKEDKGIPSTSKNPSQLLKLKKFGINRKYPLMEKSQKVLKQLKHNQSIPKMRAHLSSVPSSPAKKHANLNYYRNALPIRGKAMQSKANTKRNLHLNKNIHNQGFENSNPRKFESVLKGTEKSTVKKNQSSQNTVLKSHLNSKNIPPSSTKRPKAACKNVNKSSNTSSVRSENSVGNSKKSKSLHGDEDCNTYYKRSYFRRNSIAKNVTDDRSDSSVHSRSNSSLRNRSDSSVHSRSNSSLRNRSNSSASSRSNSSISSRSIVNKGSSNILNDRNNSSIDTTDSEFEKFVEKNKKDLKKKSRKKAVKKTVKKTPKRTIRKLSDSDCSDDEVSPIKHKKNKRRKVVAHEKLKSKSKVVTTDEDVGLIDEDMCTRDSSSESDTTLVNTTCSSLSFQSKSNESYVSLPEPKSEKDKAESEVLMAAESEADLLDGDMHRRDSSSERDTAHVDTNFYASLPEPNAITGEDNIMSLYNNQTQSTNSEKAHQKQMAWANSSLDSDNCVERASLITSESSLLINEASNVEKLENEIPECIELSSSEEDNCLSSDLCLNSATEESSKSGINISVYSEAATLNSTVTDPEKSDLKTGKAILNASPKDSEESDIEIIDVVVSESKKAECSIAIDNNHSANSLGENSVNYNAQRIKCEPQNEQMPGIQIKKENEPPKNIVVTDSNHGAVFTTDICKGIDSHDTEANEIKYTSSDRSSCDQFTTVRIKKEKNDDDVIIIDSVKTLARLGNEKLASEDINVLSNQGKITIKRESPDLLVDYVSDIKKMELKIKLNPMEQNDDIKKEDNKLKVSGSNILPTKSPPDSALRDLIPSLQFDKLDTPEKNKAFSQLIKLYKQELETYQELLEVENNLESRLKQIEFKQHNKIQQIRSLIENVLRNKQSKVDDSLKIEEAINKMGNSKDFKNLDTKECMHNLVSNCSSKINSEKREEVLSQKEQNISTKLSLKSSPLSLAVENRDEKTNFSSSLLIKPKLEPVSDEDTMNMSDIAMKLLGEKCVICSKNAVAACQKCAKVFFCSNECGIKSWNGGHKVECGKL